MARKAEQITESKQAATMGEAEMKKSVESSVGVISAAAESSASILPEEASLANFGAEYRSRCGGALRASREKQGLTTQEIASRLRLSSKQIEALEADNFAALPETTIVKGFIRNYAKVLKISAEPLLDAYNVIVPGKELQSITLKPAANMKVTEYAKPNTKRYVLIGLAIFFGLGAWLFYQNYVQKPNPVMPTAELIEPSAKSSQIEALPEAALPAAERATNETVTQLTLPRSEPGSVTDIATAGVATAVSPPPPVANQTVPVTTPASNSPLAPQPPATQTVPDQVDYNAGMSNLEFNASQETWISVTDATGKEIYNKILFAGNREVLQAKPPLNVVVGNALGATLSVNGKPLDLAPHTRVNVAHVKLD